MEDRKARVLPTDIDVLCGSGKGKANHPGNRRFRCIVTKHCAKYVTAKTKAEKMKVSKTILLEVLRLGARIIQKHPIHEEWYVADPKVGRDKISHCLRLIKAATKRTDGRDLDTRMIQQPDNRQSVTLDNHQLPIAGVGDKSRQGSISVRQQHREQHPNVLLDTMVPFPVSRRSLALPPPQQSAITRIIKAEYPFWSRSYTREEIKPSYYHLNKMRILTILTCGAWVPLHNIRSNNNTSWWHHHHRNSNNNNNKCSTSTTANEVVAAATTTSHGAAANGSSSTSRGSSTTTTATTTSTTVKRPN